MPSSVGQANFSIQSPIPPQGKVYATFPTGANVPLEAKIVGSNLFPNPQAAFFDVTQLADAYGLIL